MASKKTDDLAWAEARHEAAAREAADLLRENGPRTKEEQQAIAELDKRRWVLWHADDYSLGVIRLLSAGGLLRDKEYEKVQSTSLQAEADRQERERFIAMKTIQRLEELVEAAADSLDKGDDAAKTAVWLRETCKAILDARERGHAGIDAPTAREAA